MGYFACSLEEEATHNKVVEDYARFQFPEKEYDVRLNLGDAKNHALDGMYPDIIARHRATGAVCVAEVKTETFISPAAAEQQWAPFSRVADEFHLVVPSGLVHRVRSLCLGIAVDRLVAYYSEPDLVEFRVITQQPAVAS